VFAIGMIGSTQQALTASLAAQYGKLQPADAILKTSLRWMGEPEGYDELYVDTSGTSKEEIRLITDEVSDRIEWEGLPVYSKTLPNLDKHPLSYIIDTVLLLLGLVAVLLVINIISALIVQQEQQIGIMKAIGARLWQIIGLYFGMVLALGLINFLGERSRK
jgi:ABC-type antimicrobial peptide transport system permease subunit